MENNFYRIFIVVMGLFLFSCQENEKRQDTEVDIIPSGSDTTLVTGKDRPMPRSYMIAKMRENGELSAFIAQLKNTGMEEEFEGREGIYTFFAPSNAAYDRIPAKEIDTKADESIEDAINYYMVKGEMTIDFLREKIRASKEGRYEFETALGEKMWATEEGGKIILIDVLGNKASIITPKMEKNYGVYHIIDNVLQPGRAGE